MSDQVKEIKQKADIVGIISERLKLKKAGRNFQALCPFHNEKTPSFNISPELQIYKCFGCFPGDELIKTPFGLQHIESIRDGDYVISGKGQIQKVLTTHKRNYEGKLVTLRVRKLSESVRLTSDHLVYIVDGASMYRRRYKYLSKRLHEYNKYPREKRLSKTWKYFPIKKVKAGELRKGMTLLYPINGEVKDIERLDLTEYITKEWPKHGSRPLVPSLNVNVSEDFLKLIGYYIAEGSNHRGYIRFSLGNHEEKFAKEIVSLLDKIFDLSASIYRRAKGSKTGIEVICCNSVLANVFENLCGKGAENKYIPFVFQQLPRDKQQVLVDAIFKGDGHLSSGGRSSSEYKNITSISRVLVGQIRDFLLRLSYFPTVVFEKGKVDKNGVNHKNSFTVNWLVNPKKAMFRHVYEDQEGNKYWLLPVWKKKTSVFRGKVYNLTVENDHSYVANNFSVANCGESGDVYEFLEKFEGMEFSEALRFMADKVGVKLKDFRPSKQSQENEKLMNILNLVGEFYQYLLMEHRIGEEARQYLKNRGIWKKTMQKFQLGFAPDSWEVLQKYMVGRKKHLVVDLEKVGLVIKSSRGGGGRYYDRFRGRIMFPLKNQRGQIMGFSGRLLEKDAKQAKYVNTPETSLYHKSELLYGLSIVRQEIKKEERVIVAEGELDVLSSWQGGVKNIVAIKGSALTVDQVKLISRYCKNILLALDADKAGDAATKRGIMEADKQGLSVRVIEIKGGKDPDDIAQRDKALWKKMVNKSVSVYDFYLSSALRRGDATSGEGKRRISEELVPIFSEIINQVEQAHYVKKLARVLGVSEEVIGREIERVKGYGGVKERVEKKRPGKIKKEDLMDEYVLRMLLNSGVKMGERVEMVKLKWFRSLAIKKVVRVIGDVGEKIVIDGVVDVKELMEKLPEELRAVVEQVWMVESQEKRQGRLSEKEFEKGMEEFRKRYLKRRLNMIAEKIELLESKKLSKKKMISLDKLQEKFVRFSGMLRS